MIGLVSIYLRWRYHGRLRDRHRTQWEALGSPSRAAGPFRSIGELRFLWSSSYRSLDDRYLNRLAFAMKFFEPLFFLLLMCSEEVETILGEVQESLFTRDGEDSYVTLKYPDGVTFYFF